MKKPLFTRRHYIILAQLIHESRYEDISDKMIDRIRQMLIADNPNFDVQQFNNALRTGASE